MKLGKLLPVLFFLLFIGILSVGYVYFFIISPTFIEKPILELPQVIENQSFSEEQIFYVMNEINAYKLHNNPFSNEPPLIEFIIEGKSIFVEIKNNNFKSIETGNPDLKIYLDEKDLFELLQSEDFEEKLLEKYTNYEIDIEIIADEVTLAVKGYKSIYDKIASSNEVTGNIVKLNPDDLTNGINISLLLFISLIMNLIIKKI